MKVIILAAGSGNRLKPYTNDKPKCLVDVDGHKLITSQLSILRSKREISEIIIVGGYKANMLAGLGDKLVVNKRYASSNMVYSLYSAIEDISGEVIISYADIVYDVEILEQMLSFSGTIGVAIDSRWYDYWSCRFEDPLEDAETLEIDLEGHIVDIGRKPNHLSEIQGQYMGLVRLNADGAKHFRQALLELYQNPGAIKKADQNLYFTDFLMKLINSGQKVKAITHEQDWIEVDSKADLLLPETKLRLQKMLSKAAGIHN